MISPFEDDPLIDLQRWMIEALVHPERAEPDALERHLLPSPRQGAAARLAIYQRSYILRLTRCLAEQFPALCHALGGGLFDDFAREYLTACPSDSYTLHELGRRFPAWLDDNRPDVERPAPARESWIDFMVDLARYERELFRLYDAPGHEPGAWPTHQVPDERLVLQPCFALGCYRFPVAWYYHEVRAERAPAFPPAREDHLAIARRDHLTSTFPINPVHHRFLQAMQEHAHVPTALERVAEGVGRPLGEVRASWEAQVRRPWIDAGFFVERVDGTAAPGVVAAQARSLIQAANSGTATR